MLHDLLSWLKKSNWSYIYIDIYTLNRHKFDYYSTGLTPDGNARKDEIKENIGRKNV